MSPPPDKRPLRFLRSFRADRNGSVAVISAILATVLVVGTGVSVDLARAYSARSKLQNAVDQTALAVGANSPNATSVSSQMQSVANDFLAANDPSGNGVTVSKPSLAMSGQSVAVSATAQIDTTFLGIAGIPSVSVAATGTALRSVSGIEVVLVLDNTASLDCCSTGGKTNFQQLQVAATQLATALFGSVTSNNPLLRVSVVPYTGAVNAAPVAPSMISGAPKISSSWTGCVIERYATFGTVTTGYAGASSVYDAVASDLDSPVGSAGYLLKYQNTGGNSNSGCPSAVQPLTNTLSSVTTAITAMNDAGGSGTIGSVGMAWGYRVLSPQGPFTGVETVNCWATQSCASKGWQKVVVLMTDGVNSPEGHSYNGFGTMSGNAPGAKGCSATLQNYNGGSCESATDYAINQDSGQTLVDKQEEAVCDALRARGVTIFSVFLNSGTTPGAAIKYCAGTQPGDGTNSGYFYSESNSSLVQRFTAIGEQLTNLRLVQ